MSEIQPLTVLAALVILILAVICAVLLRSRRTAGERLKLFHAELTEVASVSGFGRRMDRYCALIAHVVQACGDLVAVLHEDGQRRLGVERVAPCETQEARVARNPRVRRAFVTVVDRPHRQQVRCLDHGLL